MFLFRKRNFARAANSKGVNEQRLLRIDRPSLLFIFPRNAEWQSSVSSISHRVVDVASCLYLTARD